ncbi:hypothetical protein D9M69_644790 [compost metagenome]
MTLIKACASISIWGAKAVPNTTENTTPVAMLTSSTRFQDSLARKTNARLADPSSTRSARGSSE